MSEHPTEGDDLTASLGPVDGALDGATFNDRHATDAGDQIGGRDERPDRDTTESGGDDDGATQTDDGPEVSDARVAALERRVSELEAELDSIRGLLDGVDAVDQAVERRASTALAKVEALERTVDGADDGLVRERLPEEPGSEQRTVPAQSQRVRATTETWQPSRNERPDAQTTSQSSATPGTMGEVDWNAQGDDRSESLSDDSLASRLRDAFR